MGVLAQLCNLNQVFPFKRNFEVQFKLDKYNNGNSVYCEAQKDMNSFCWSACSPHSLNFQDLWRYVPQKPQWQAIAVRCRHQDPPPCTGEMRQYLWADNHLSRFDFTLPRSRSLQPFLHLGSSFLHCCLTWAINYPAVGSKHQQRQQHAAKRAAVMETDEASVGCACAHLLGCHDICFLSYIWGDAPRSFLALLSSRRWFLSREIGSRGDLCV